MAVRALLPADEKGQEEAEQLWAGRRRGRTSCLLSGERTTYDFGRVDGAEPVVRGERSYVLQDVGLGLLLGGR